MVFAMVTFFPWSPIDDIFSSESQIYFWLHRHIFWQFILFCIFVLNVSWGNFSFLGWASSLFSPVSLIACLGIARNFFTMFLTHSSSECFLCLIYDLFCDELASFCDNFLLQFSFPEILVTSGLFSSKIKPCCNLLKYCSHFIIAMFVSLCIYINWEINCVNKCQKLLFIGLSLCLIISSNCLIFCIDNFCVVRNQFAIAFLYTSIWIACGIIFYFFIVPKFICALMLFFPSLTQNHEKKILFFIFKKN